MNTNMSRKKQPELVRANILHATAEAIAKNGLAGVSLDYVANKAGVSKGGLLHHFPNKQSLIESLFFQLLQEFEQNIEQYIAQDNNPKGRFSRAYIRAITYCDQDCYFAASVLSICIDPYFAQRRTTWLKEYLGKCDLSDNSLAATSARYAADGIWFADCTHSSLLNGQERELLIKQLITKTYST